jgi:hypothetical protein
VSANSGKSVRRLIARGDNSQAAGNNIFNGDIVTIPRLRILPTVLGKIFPILAERSLAELPENGVPEQYKQYKIEAKIEHNNVVIYKSLIAEYAQYGGIIDEVYQIYDDTDPSGRARVMRYFRAIYHQVKGEILSPASPNSSDDIIMGCISRVQSDISEGLDDASGYQEDLAPVCNMLVCHAFILCKILERPA